MYPVKIAIISDLHVGPAAKTQDMCPCPCDSSGQAFMDYNNKSPVLFRQAFLKFVRDNSIVADYLIIPGDITDTSHPMQIKLASEIITEFANEMHIPDNHIIYVPGNHDLDWTFYDSEDKTGIKWNLRYYALKSEDFIFAKTQGEHEGGLFQAPFFSTWTYDNLFVLGYNSSNHDTPIEKTHRGLISSQHVSEMRRYLSDLHLPGDKLKIFITHHHLTNLSLPVPDDPDYSLATNAQEMISLLQDFNFDFVVHGHRHHPCFDNSIKNLPILCSGSFSAGIDTRWNGKIHNQFHLLLFEKKDNRSTKGVINSWANADEDWNPSNPVFCGIDYQIPFGMSLSSEEKKETLFPELHSMLVNNRFILWEKIIEFFPDYRYLSDKQVKEVLSEFAEKEKAVFDNDKLLVYLEK